MYPPSERGQAAERRAEHYLKTQGLALRARNYRCKAGEIDLIMQDGQTLVFVEVRLRRRRGFASAAETLDERKQRKLMRAAQHYLLCHGLTDKLNCRFDLVAFDTGPGDSQTQWIQNAFGV